MAITRLQQARQMRKGGGIMGSNAGSMLVAPTKDGSRPGYYGPDAGFGGDDYKDAASDFEDQAQARVDAGGYGGGTEEQFQKARITQDTAGQEAKIAANRAKVEAAKKAEAKRIQDILDANRGKEPQAYNYGPPIVNPYGIKFGPKTKKETRASKVRKLALKNLIDKKMGNKKTGLSIFELNNLFNPTMIDSEYTYNSPITTDMMGVNPLNYMDEASYGITGKNLTDIDRMNRAIDQGRSLGNITQTEFEDAFYGPDGKPDFGGGGGDGQNQLPYIPTPADDDDNTDDPIPYRFGDNEFGAADVTRGSYIFNQGGRVPRAGGGIMNAVPRQGYFLGKIVKGVGKAIGSVADAAGKVLKSDVGKMALLYGAGAMAGSYGLKGSLFSKGMFNPMNMKAGLFGANSLAMNKLGLGEMAAKKGLLANLGLTSGYGSLAPTLKGILAGSAILPFIPGINKAPENEDIGMAVRGGRLIDPLTGKEVTPAEMRANINAAVEEAQGDPIKLAAIDQKYNNMLNLVPNTPYENYGLYANGGRIARAEGGLMNLGGMEKDYRNEGGFVPIGKQEKADDVPARLSVNEFVFTADAVRNAGGGDIDKGAEVMENMMKNLENGGTVSEESQGNTGAQEMFSVSERIGEVI